MPQEQPGHGALRAQQESRIHRLAPDVVARIAAGEMISRPAAAVKELVENALDAGGQQMTVAITEALDHSLRVSDDGCGMTAEELPRALERYSTSKIAEEEDLLAIATLGFRGEALASIAQIARVTVTSRTAAAEHAWEVRAEAGKIGPVKAAARGPGTTVLVEDLFYNTPVRKRFLRKGPGEIRLARSTLSAYAVGAPGVGWRLEVDGKRSLDLSPVSDLRSRLGQIHGTRVTDGLLEIDWQEKELTLRGFIGVPELARSGSRHQTFFVNGRWVAAPWIGQAVRHGCGDLIPSHQNPWVVLFLVMPPEQVDVNLHPTKREVRFLDERGIFGGVQRAVHQTVARLLPRFFLGNAPSTAPGRAAPPPGSAPAHSPGPTVLPGEKPVSVTRERRPPYGTGDFDGLQQAARLYGSDATTTDSLQDAGAGVPPEVVDTEATAGLVSLWQLHHRYVLAQTRKGLLIIDQHAAHERILYEQIRARLLGGAAGGQQLLFPVVLELDETQILLFREIKPSLARMGFNVEELGNESVVVRGVPPLWRARSEADLLRDLLDEAGSMGLREGETIEGLARSFACRAAIKAGEPLTVEEMNQLVDELFATERPHGDPHGRPTFVFIPLQDLNRRFGRGGGRA